MRNNTLRYPLMEPPARLKKATLDNIALVPASLLPLKGTYQPLANTLLRVACYVCQDHNASRKSWQKLQAFFGIMDDLLSPCLLRKYPAL